MSQVKLNTDLFLGQQELQRLVRFLQDDGYRQMTGALVEKYGIINNKIADPNFNNLRVVQGSNAQSITVKQGIAIDSNKLIASAVGDLIDVATVPTDSNPWFILAEYATTNIEEGTVDIQVSGQITGTLTKFLEVLRGQPNFAAKIRFPNSSLNTAEYEVVDVTDDVTALLTGALEVENGVQYQIVGTFTPDKIIPVANKDIFLYDSLTITVESTDTSVAGTKFLLAIATTDGAVMTIVDRRTDFLETKASFDLQSLDSLATASPLIGVDNIKYDGSLSDRSKNIVDVGWGFVSPNGQWLVDQQTGVISITGGTGGIFDSTANFNDGDFDGWRAYFDNGSFIEIITSTIAGSVITLVLRSFNADVNATTGELRVVPNAAEINLVFSGNQPVATRELSFPISMANAQVHVLAGFTYTASYRYLSGKRASSFQNINDGDYKNEDSFDDNGNEITESTSDVASAQFTTLVNQAALASGVAVKNAANTFSAVNTFLDSIILQLHPTELVLDALETLALNKGNFFLIDPAGNNLKTISLKGTGAFIWLMFKSSCTIIHKTNGGDNLETNFPGVGTGSDLQVHQGMWVRLIQTNATTWSVDMATTLNHTPNRLFTLGKDLTNQDQLEVSVPLALNSRLNKLLVNITNTAARTWDLPDLSGSLIPAPLGISTLTNLEFITTGGTISMFAYTNSAATAGQSPIQTPAAVIITFFYIQYGKWVMITGQVDNVSITGIDMWGSITLEGFPFVFGKSVIGFGRTGTEETGRKMAVVRSEEGTSRLILTPADAGFINNSDTINIFDFLFNGIFIIE